MKNLTQYIQEKLHINKFHKSEKEFIDINTIIKLLKNEISTSLKNKLKDFYKKYNIEKFAFITDEESLELFIDNRTDFKLKDYEKYCYHDDDLINLTISYDWRENNNENDLHYFNLSNDESYNIEFWYGKYGIGYSIESNDEEDDLSMYINFLCVDNNNNIIYKQNKRK